MGGRHTSDVGRSLVRLPAGPNLSRERQTARMVMRPLAFLEESLARFGDVFTLRVVDESPWVVVGDPELIRDVFRAPAGILHAGEGKRILEPVVGANSVLLLDEDRYLDQRKLLLPPFSAGRVGRYEHAMRAAAERALGEWPLERDEPAIGWTRSIALEAILRAVFGMQESGRLGPLREPLRELSLPGNAREASAPGFRALIDRVDDLLFAEIAEHRSKGDGNGSGEPGDDVLSLLLAARHEDGSPMSEREIRDELMSMLVAGYETTATTLAWALERLARSPDVLARAQAEADDGPGPYIDAVIEETLRIRPALPLVARAVKAPFQLGDHLIPAGVTIVPAILLVHHRADLYPEPTAFRPERFLDRQPDPHTWIPFGGGIRRCLGARFALLEMRVVLSTLLARFNVRAEESEDEAPRRRDVTLTPARGARVILERRRARRAPARPGR